MEQEIEIEFKNLLTELEYNRLLDALRLNDSDAKKQVNYYFETPSFHLKEKGCALRIREKEGKYRFTLKQPHETGLLETHEDLSEPSFQAQLKQVNLPSSIANELQALQVPTDKLQYKGELTTYRLEMDWKDCLLVLDHSYYQNKEDFELELEAKDYKAGHDVFVELLQNYSIPKRKTPNKIERFFNATR